VAEIPEGVITPPERHPSGGDRLVCEYCECQLGADGKVLRRSARAKSLIQLDTDLEAATARAAALQSELASVQTELERVTREYRALSEKAANIWK